MSIYFKELDYRVTPMGILSLRRRREPSLGIDVIEIKLNDEFLMSSLFTASEIALAHLGLAPLAGLGSLDALVGGLGLGHTAHAVLEHDAVQSLIVVERLGAVIDWHEQGLVPLGARLAADPRCRLMEGDFFALSQSPVGFDPAMPSRGFHAILVDIDHSPRHLLHPSHALFYSKAGLSRLAGHLHPSGVFALWSNDPPDAAFISTLREAFASAEARVVTFGNPLRDENSANTIYVARTGNP